MKKVIFSIVFLFSNSSFASTPEKTVKIPPQNILAAARSIVPQKGYDYFVAGELSCGRVIREPYSQGYFNGFQKYSSTCIINIDGKKAFVNNPDEIIVKLQEINPKLEGLNWSLTVDFLATSFNEAPSYSVTEIAMAYLCHPAASCHPAA